MPQFPYFAYLRDDAWALESHHVDLPPRQAQVVALEASGLTHSEIASALGTSTSSVRNSAYTARNKVVPLSRFRSRNCAVAWAWMHRDCCLAQTMRRSVDIAIYMTRISAIDDAHHDDLSAQRQAILVAQSLGHSARTASDLLGIATRTVQFHNDQLRHEVLPDDVDDGHATLIAWAYRHAKCCLAPNWLPLLNPRAS